MNERRALFTRFWAVRKGTNSGGGGEGGWWEGKMNERRALFTRFWAVRKGTNSGGGGEGGVVGGKDEWKKSTVHAVGRNVRTWKKVWSKRPRPKCPRSKRPRPKRPWPKRPSTAKGQLSYSVWQSLDRIHFSLIILAETISRWMRVGNPSTWRKPLTTSFRKCYILKLEKSSPNWGSNPHSRIGCRPDKQAC